MLILGIGIVIGATMNAEAQKSSSSIPTWIKNTAKWWGEGQISDDEYIKSIQWLIDQKILVIPQVVNVQTQSQKTTESILLKYLPNSSDLGVLWNVAIGNNKTVDSYGFEKGIEAVLKKETSDKPTIIVVELYQFDQSFNAEKYYRIYGGGNQYSGLPYTIGGDECGSTNFGNFINQGILFNCKVGTSVFSVKGQGNDPELEHDTLNIVQIIISRLPSS
ncbi:MAG: hypothetical protein KGI19_08830 [Thaumarchaeota archaeon]|nr:hypothetical protein [Nitrososphaerota archaeon]